MLVEEESLIAMLTQSIVEGEDCLTTGLYSDQGSALKAAHGEAVDVGRLDINQSGHMVFPMADRLSEPAYRFCCCSATEQRTGRCEPSRSSSRSCCRHYAV